MHDTKLGGAAVVSSETTSIHRDLGNWILEWVNRNLMSSLRRAAKVLHMGQNNPCSQSGPNWLSSSLAGKDLSVTVGTRFSVTPQECALIADEGTTVLSWWQHGQHIRWSPVTIPLPQHY